MSYRCEDWYSPEAKAQIELLNALGENLKRITANIKVHIEISKVDIETSDIDNALYWYHWGRLDASDRVLYCFARVSDDLFIKERDALHNSDMG